MQTVIERIIKTSNGQSIDVTIGRMDSTINNLVIACKVDGEHVEHAFDLPRWGRFYVATAIDSLQGKGHKFHYPIV